MQQAKLKSAGILYAAIDASANLEDLKSSDLLYVGCQTLDRVFRGDGLQGKNFHHREVRVGHTGKTLETHLVCGHEAVVYTVTGDEFKRLSQMRISFA